MESCGSAFERAEALFFFFFFAISDKHELHAIIQPAPGIRKAAARKSPGSIRYGPTVTIFPFIKAPLEPGRSESIADLYSTHPPKSNFRRGNWDVPHPDPAETCVIPCSLAESRRLKIPPQKKTPRRSTRVAGAFFRRDRRRSVDGAESTALFAAKIIVRGVGTATQEGSGEPRATLEDPAKDGDRVRDVATSIIIGVQGIRAVVAGAEVSNSDLDDQDSIIDVDTAIAISVTTEEILNRRRRSFGGDRQDLIRGAIGGRGDLVGIVIKVGDITDIEAGATDTGVDVESEEVSAFESGESRSANNTLDLSRSGSGGANGEAVAGGESDAPADCG